MHISLSFYKIKNILLLISIGTMLAGCVSIPGMPPYDSQLTPKSQRSIPGKDFKLVKLGYDNIHYFSRPSRYRLNRFNKKLKNKRVKEKYPIKGHARSVADYNYRIGARDILSITVWGHPELTIPAGEFRSPTAAGHKVSEQGYFFFPFVGKIKASGRTPEEVRLELTEKLSKFIKDPQVGVSIAAYRSQRAYISGQVMQAGMFIIDDTPLTVRDIISKAGGLKQFVIRSKGASYSKSKSYNSSNFSVSSSSSGSNASERTIMPERALLTTAAKAKIQIDLKALFARGDKSQNYILHGGDALHVFLPKQLEQKDEYEKEQLERLRKLFVLGEVRKPGTIIMDENGVSLAEALSDRGGINEDTANAKGIFVIRSYARKEEKLRPVVFQLELKSVHSMILAEKFALYERDIVYVTAAPISRWNRVISQILPSLDATTSVDNLSK
jgi:polysaccharide export outer membrane protein